MPSVFETRRCLPISATLFDVRATKPELTILAGREAATSILVLSRHAASVAGAVTRGEPRDVRS